MVISCDLLIKSLRNATKFIGRDFLELELMQSNARSNQDFINKSCKRIEDNFQYALSKYCDHLIFLEKNINYTTDCQDLLLIQIMNGYNNFTRSMSHFATLITHASIKDSKISASANAIIFPALNQLFYTEKGKGVAVEDLNATRVGVRKVRVSGNKAKQDIAVGTELKYIKHAASYSKNIRIFGCSAYLVILLISGKLDVIYISSNNLTNAGFELLIKESGGMLYYQDDMIVASNILLQN